MNASQIKAEVVKTAELVSSDLRRGWIHVRINGSVFLVWVFKGINAEQIAATIAEAPKYSLCLSKAKGSRYFSA